NLFQSAPHRLAFALALEDLGNILATTERDRSVKALSQALSAYTEMGATWDARRVRGRLREFGVRRRVVPSRERESGWPALTPSEVGVARLVAEGLTNREVSDRLFLSPHTVSSHLRHVFAKLGINSRVELARLARDYEMA